MSYIPDCRTDEYYNQKYLNEKDAEFIKGYDYAVEQIKNLFEGNLGATPELEELLDDNKAIILEGKAEIAKDAIEEWAEIERDEVITSMIEGYDDDEYQRIKEAVDGREGQGTEGN